MTWLAWYIALTFLLAGLAWWPCCCKPRPDVGKCDRCSGETPASLALTISGIVDGDCDDCDAMNTTWILPFNSEVSGEAGCIWETSGELDCGGRDIPYSVLVALETIGTAYNRWRATVFVGDDLFDPQLSYWTASHVFADTDPVDCLDTYPLVFTSASAGLNQYCGPPGTITMQVN